jgi:hypothetical protein
MSVAPEPSEAGWNKVTNAREWFFQETMQYRNHIMRHGLTKVILGSGVVRYVISTHEVYYEFPCSEFITGRTRGAQLKGTGVQNAMACSRNISSRRMANKRRNNKK